MTTYDITDYRITEHTVEVPVDWSDPLRFGAVSIFVREVGSSPRSTPICHR